MMRRAEKCRKVKQIKISNSETKINVEDLGSGFYFYEVRGNDETVRTTGKIVIK
ncbi:MAG: T9SS type A sorting domain-containing protein [Chlorobi bacterium]|nr:T9SS type A sorting domain-containing protein [Chlorobiota bacterium]